MFLRHSSRDARRGVILIVVLALLTLFAIVGLSFVLYAQAEAESSRLYKEEKTLRQVLESPDRMMAHAWSKLLYDEDDNPLYGAPGVYSSIRGHSLARSMYGNDDYYDPTTGFFVPNQTPFNGTGELAATNTMPGGPPLNQLVNFTYFPLDNFLRDPERSQFRAGPNAPRNPITGGRNVPYTYPDLNNMFLGAINAGGQVLMPSFHRPWLFGAIDPTSQPTGANPNANWTNMWGKYLTLRPRPIDMGPNFPYPEDAGGDVKNLYWLPGGNDSIWIDLNYPVQVAPDGRKYKPLFAFFITDLDNRINLNAHGNIRGGPGSAQAHLSNQGWVKTEVNLSNVLIPGVPSANPLAPAIEWQQLFTGVPTPGPGSFNQVTIRGRYGWDLIPNDPNTYTAGNFSAPGTFPHVYGQVDFDGGQQTFVPTLPILLPNQILTASGGTAYTAFPAFGAVAAGVQTSTGYDNGGGGATGIAERANHPQIFDTLKPFSDPINPPIAPDNRPAIDDRNFPVFEMIALLNGGLVADASASGPYGAAPIMAANAMKSQLGLLLPYNFNDPLDIAGSLRRRSLVTTLSMDMSRPGMSPWMWDAGSIETATPSLVSDMIQAQRPGDDAVMSRAPWGLPSGFPDPQLLRSGPIPSNSEFNLPGSPAGSPASNWRAAIQSIRQIIGRTDLSQTLPLYPNQINPAITRFDSANPVSATDTRPINAVYALAHQARVNLATDIYRTLRKLVGVQAIPVADQPSPTEAELMPRRWLAQLAVNIVDFVDSDNISTPLNFYPDNEPVTPPLDAVIGMNGTSTTTATSTNNIYPSEIYRYWVFGTELPRVVVNEVFAEYTPTTTGANTTRTINVYAELLNTLPPLVPAPNQGIWDPSDAANIPLYVAAGAGTVAYSPYRVILASTAAATGGPLTPRTSPPGPVLPTTTAYGNDNVAGTPDQVRTMTVDDTGVWLPPGVTPAPYLTGAAFSGTAYQVTNPNPPGNNGNITTVNPNGMALAPGQFLVIGAGTVATATTAGAFTQDANKQIPLYLGDKAVAVPTPAMSYTVLDTTGMGNWTINGVKVNDNVAGNGITVLLRRLINPYMPPSMTPVSPLDPTFNPFCTNDFMDGIVPNAGTVGNKYNSIGKLQPYASANILTPAVGQIQTYANQLTTISAYFTLGQMNTNAGGTSPTTVPPLPAYDWLVHLDRQLVSPMELLNVSGFHPHELTHRFITATPDTTDPLSPKFGHRVHWFDQSNRLYRLFEFLEVTDRAYGVTSLGRRPGKININTVWDVEILRALFDPQSSNYFGQTTDDVLTMYTNLLNGRSPSYLGAIGANTPLSALTAADRPFLGMGAGNLPYGDNFFPNGSGINDTFLRTYTMAYNNPTFDATTQQGHPEQPRLFENPNSLVQTNAGPPPSWGPNPAAPNLSNPYIRFEPLNKVYNNLTTRSNVFAVWCTIGYFEVTDDTARPVKLGAEIGKAAGTNVRHRFFGVVDRTEMVIARNLISSASGAGGTLVNPTNPLLGPGQAWVELDMAPVGATVVNGSIVGQAASPNPGRPPVLWSISPGSVLVVDRGTANEEWVLVTSISPTLPPGQPAQSAASPVWVQATFIRPHLNSGFGITQPGNPGPQPPIDVRDYFHAPVVPVSVNLNN
jgi:hypothetical protein